MEDLLGNRRPFDQVAQSAPDLAPALRTILAAPLALHVPLAVLAGILLFVAWNMGEWREFPRLKQFSPQYRTVMLSTFLLTVIIDLTVAIEFGMVLAALFFIFRVSSLTSTERVTDEALPAGVDYPGLPQHGKKGGGICHRLIGCLHHCLQKRD